MEKIKVLVVDDSLFMRRMIVRLVEEDENIQVVGTARNGVEGVKLVKELRPDVVTMDIEMPEMNGIEALGKIMEELPTRVVMLSSLTKEGAEETITALQSGAVDFIAKPSGSVGTGLTGAREEIIGKIKAAARTPLSVLIAARRGGAPQTVWEPKRAVPEAAKEFRQIVAIGTSTGGPKALETVLTGLPADFPYPVLVVQHMPPKFTLSLAQRLNNLCRIRVVEAEDGQLVQGGTAYIAPGGFHMTLTKKRDGVRIALHQEPPQNGHRPSVDVMFDSVSALPDLKKHYVLMTGMGSDGAKAMAQAKRQGAESTIAEAQDSCVVFGMPRAAISLNCVDHVVPVTVIAAKIRQLTKA
ncbi:chemotaxis response regulator protein-glutamate methylesterase [Paenibacillus sp. Marseille-P2973]|uniref:protein-glutamate methylesterase/protein-glutamine glutaminase n=1 Tax=Paenibacillus sp. Marseille-P2973 TaxID=1871032 RepID=UPI001B365261|nr:chemotaxis response regulator protein-glutamate methylesterase [Paenibacillus sp. Marseille-P2973]MBQ4901287.1 chemotaxis response regulator protein-glutamate methylesterase [Paenibacillus sp. Marseille-P2973]